MVGSLCVSCLPHQGGTAAPLRDGILVGVTTWRGSAQPTLWTGSLGAAL